MHERFEHTVVDQHVPTSGQTFSVDVGRRVGQRIGGVIDEGDQRTGHRLTETLREQASPLHHALAVERAADDSEELGRHVRIEHHGDATTRGLRGTEQSRGAVNGVASRLVDVEFAGVAPDGETETGLRLIAIIGECADAQVTAVLSSGHTNARGGRDRRLTERVGIVGIVDADTGVAGTRQTFELLGQFDLA